MTPPTDIGQPDELVHIPEKGRTYPKWVRPALGVFAVVGVTLSVLAGAWHIGSQMRPSTPSIVLPAAVKSTTPAEDFAKLMQHYQELTRAYAKAPAVERVKIAEEAQALRAKLITLVNSHPANIFPPEAARFILPPQSK